MTDANIGALPKAPQVDDESLLVMEQQGQAMSLTGKQIKDYAKQGLELNFKEDVDAANDAADRAVSAASAVTGMTVDAHSSDTPTVEKSMRSGKVHLEFGLPKGDVGPVGPEGPEGPRGKQGIPGTGKAILGHYNTEEELRSSVTSPEVGDPYSVGAETPFDIWIFDGPTQNWINYGPLSLSGGGVTPEDAVTTDGGAEMFFWNGPGLHKIEITDEDLPPLTASDVVYGDGTVDKAIEQLFTSGSEAKSLISSAVTAKGVPTSADDTWAEMADNIGKIETGGGGGDYGDATATPGDILAGKTAYVATGKVEGIIPTLGPQVYTPSVEAQQISNGQYLGGTQIIQGDTNLTPANIRKGVSIFGVDGAMTSTFQATLTVTVDIGAVVTATHTTGDKVEGLSTTGKVVLELPIEGKWTVTAQRGVAQYNSVVITVSSQYTASLTAEIHIKYFGTITPLSVSRTYLASASGNSHALFVGGTYRSGYTDTNQSTCVDAYSESLVHTTPTPISIGVRSLAGTMAGNYFVFAGGYYTGSNTNIRSVQSIAYAYNDSSLTFSSDIEVINYPRYSLGAAKIGKYALLAGGTYQYGNSSQSRADVDYYDDELTHGTANDLSIGGTTVGAENDNYAIFFSRQNATAYNKALSRTIIPQFPTVFPTDAGAARAGSYVMVANGTAAYAYDLFLTRVSCEPLSTSRISPACTTLKNFAIFANSSSGESSTSQVDVYDLYLTHTTVEDIPQSISSGTASAIGKYALITGGGSAVYAYQYE